MSDIAMCRNRSCPSSKKCYRFRAIPKSEWQSYTGFAVTHGDLKCSHFVSIKGIDESELVPLNELYSKDEV